MNRKKLSFKKITVANLDAHQMRHLQGGLAAQNSGGPSCTGCPSGKTCNPGTCGGSGDPPEFAM